MTNRKQHLHQSQRSCEGTSVWIDANNREAEVNLQTDTACESVIWGHVTNGCQVPVNGALVRLMKYRGDCMNLQTVDETYTDCNGYYRFDLSPCGFGKYCVTVEEAPLSYNTACPGRNNVCYF